MKILMVNPNANSETTKLLVDVARSCFTGTEFTVIGITAGTGPSMITGAAQLRAAGPDVVTASLESIEQHAPDAVIIGAFGDPGAPELRSLVDIPVVGIGEAAILRAAGSGRRYAIATTTGELTAELVALAEKTAPDGDFAGVFLTETTPLALATDPAASLAELGKAVDDAIAAGAEAVIIGGGPLSDSARTLSLRTDIDIIEPIPSAVAMAMDRIASAVRH
ncbi:MAG: aspartate/glutamate racemase family protein [Rhodococcus sp. (in: high G+C Gram-positive bacteria)]